MKNSLIKALDSYKSESGNHLGTIDIVGGAIISLTSHKDREPTDIDIYGGDIPNFPIYKDRTSFHGYYKKTLVKGWGERRQIIYESDWLKIRAISDIDMLASKLFAFRNTMLNPFNNPEILEKHALDFYRMKNNWSELYDSHIDKIVESCPEKYQKEYKDRLIFTFDLLVKKKHLWI